MSTATTRTHTRTSRSERAHFQTSPSNSSCVGYTRGGLLRPMAEMKWRSHVRPVHFPTLASVTTKLVRTAQGRAGAAAALIAFSTAAGVMAAVASPTTVLVVCLGVVWWLAVTFARAALLKRRERRERRETLARSLATGSLLPDRRLRVPRVLYLLGVLFVGELAFRPGGAGTLSDIFFLAALAWTVAELALRRGRMPFDIPRPLLLALLVFLIGGVASATASRAPVQSLAVLVRVAYITVVWFWLGMILLEKPEHLRLAVVLWVASIALSGAAALAQLSFGDILPHGAAEPPGRYSGLTEHVNDLGGSAGIVFVPALVVLAIPGGRTLARIGQLCLLALVIAASVLSGSVGGALAAGMGLIVWLSSKRVRRGYTGSLMLPVAVCVIAALLLGAGGATESPLQRISTAAGPSSARSTLSIRTATIDVALQHIRREPFVGVGLDIPSSSVEVATPGVPRPHAYQIHNVLVASWYGAGLLGLLGIAVMLASLLVVGCQCLVAARTGEESLMALGLSSALCSFLVFAMGAPVLFQRYGWISAALLLVVRAQQIRRAASEQVLLARSVGVGREPTALRASASV